MKKFFSTPKRAVISTLCLVAVGMAVLAGIVWAVAGKGLIGKEEAEAAALADAGLSRADVSALRARLGWEDGRFRYEVDFYSGGREYEYEIQARDGDIISRDIEGDGAGFGRGIASGLQEGSQGTPAQGTQTAEPKPGGEQSGTGVPGEPQPGAEQPGEAQPDAAQPNGESQSGFPSGEESPIDPQFSQPQPTAQQSVKGPVSPEQPDGAQPAAQQPSESQPAAQPDGAQPPAQQPSAGLDSGQPGESQPAAQQAGGPGEAAAPAAADAGAPRQLTPQEAQGAALADAGLTEEQVTFRKTRLDYDGGVPVYEVEFYTADTEYDYEIHASEGTVYGKDVELFRTPAAASGDGAQASSGTYIEVSQAEEIALNHAQLSRTDVRFGKEELDYDDGRAEYEIEFYYGGKEYSYTLDAVSGSILEYDIDVD